MIYYELFTHAENGCDELHLILCFIKIYSELFSERNKEKFLQLDMYVRNGVCNSRGSSF